MYTDCSLGAWRLILTIGGEKMTAQRNKQIYWVTIILSNLALIACEYFLSATNTIVLGIRWDWTASVAIVHILYTLASIKIIGPQEQAAVVFLGNPLFGITSGPYYVPFLSCWLIRETRLMIQIEIPDEPEKIWHGEEVGEIVLPQGKVPPIRITHAQGEDSKDPLDMRYTSEPTFITRYKIDNIVEFATTVGSRAEVKRQIEDAIVSRALEDLTKKTVAETFKALSTVNEELKKETEELVTNWGITVESCRVKGIGLSKSLNSSLSSMAQSSAERIATVEKAKGEQQKRELEGKGEASAILAVIDARTEGLTKQATALGRKHLAETVIAAEAAPRALAASKSAIVIGSSSADLFTSLVSAARVAKDIEKKEEGES